VSRESEERRVHGFRVRIDRELCVGFGDCVTEAPEAFRLDNADLATFEYPERTTPETLLHACDACPVDAITVWDAEGRQIVP
jgi:ferredoxin